VPEKGCGKTNKDIDKQFNKTVFCVATHFLLNIPSLIKTNRFDLAVTE
jgi:hypothetical protein